MIDDTKKPPVDFLVRLAGPGIRPWTVPTRVLSRILDALQRLVEQADEDEEYGESKSEVQQESLPTVGSGFLRLITLKTGSAVYGISAKRKDPALDIIRSTGKAIISPDRSEWPESTISSIKSLSEAAGSMDCYIELIDPNLAGKDVIAKITPNTFNDVSASAFVKGETSISGRIERVGGVSSLYCGLRLPDQSKMIICHVKSEDVVMGLGKHLYQTVSLNGVATWLRHNWRVRYFDVQSFDEPKTGSIREALVSTYNAGGKAWDKIADPDAYIAEMR